MFDLIDSPVEAKLLDAPPYKELSIKVSTVDSQKRSWSNVFSVQADSSGTVDLTAACQVHDKFPWDSHALVHQLAAEERTRWTNWISFTLQPLTILVEAFDREGKRLAYTEYVRSPVGPGVKMIEIRSDGVVGNLFIPSHSVDSRGVLVVPGAWGGLDWSNQVAAIIASHGRPAMALAYFDWQAEFGLQNRIENVPLEYLTKASGLLRSMPCADSGWITVIGMSKGAEYVMAWASFGGQVDEIIALSPSLYTWESVRLDGEAYAQSSWTLEGEPLPFLCFDADEEFYRTLDKTLLQKFHERAVSDAGMDSPARIPVERISARMLLIAQAEDTLWPASSMAGNIVSIRMRHSSGADVERVVVPGRGHAMFVSGVPANGVDASSRENGLAQTEVWSRILRFLDI
ncbi:acyl-CoA thioester hydrolase/BAAT C-terminal domain-containing protein [Actinomyces wuliandei]|uniref:acyl-CoA thioester hydrolase/BAAT C-terminal domain-containing protein n=1 Tax=Actinomyces wuliandei TaxID=2057743 RepID=UPI0015D5863A|nr:acyl-CoA thioester hydrolase/BAAT C-terminal domain-containing protein [Actinomyces wuliandei]